MSAGGRAAGAGRTPLFVIWPGSVLYYSILHSTLLEYFTLCSLDNVFYRFYILQSFTMAFRSIFLFSRRQVSPVSDIGEEWKGERVYCLPISQTTMVFLCDSRRCLQYPPRPHRKSRQCDQTAPGRPGAQCAPTGAGHRTLDITFSAVL